MALRGKILPRRTKALFYILAGPLMGLNGAFYRAWRAPRKGTIRVHLGPGQRNYLYGWINVDANCFYGKCDVWADLRKRLPFRDETVDVFYSHHVIEHLPDLGFHFREMQRCLKPGGVLRVGGPHGESAIMKYVEGDGRWFSDFPVKRRSIGGRFENFIFCQGEHLTILTPSYLEELASNVGFSDVATCRPMIETNYSDWITADVLQLESDSDQELPHTLIIEARKLSST